MPATMQNPTAWTIEGITARLDAAPAALQDKDLAQLAIRAAQSALAALDEPNDQRAADVLLRDMAETITSAQRHTVTQIAQRIQAMR